MILADPTSPRVEEVLARPGSEWTIEETEVVCDWIFEDSQYRQLLYWSIRLLGPLATAEDAEDVLAEFLLQKLQGIIKSYIPERSSFLGYLVGCLRQFTSRARVTLERRSPPGLLLISGASSKTLGVDENTIADTRADVQASLEVQERLRAFDRALKALPQRYSRVVELHYFQDKTIDEISRILGLSPSNVKVRLHRARRLLAGLVQSEGKGK